MIRALRYLTVDEGRAADLATHDESSLLSTRLHGSYRSFLLVPGEDTGGASDDEGFIPFAFCKGAPQRARQQVKNRFDRADSASKPDTCLEAEPKA